MNREAILSTLRGHAAIFRRMGVSHMFLFGSVARGDASAASDVDLFFDFDTPDFSLIELVTLRDRVSALLRAPADIMSRGSIHPRLRPTVEESAVQVF